MSVSLLALLYSWSAANEVDALLLLPAVLKEDEMPSLLPLDLRQQAFDLIRPRLSSLPVLLPRFILAALLLLRCIISLAK